jgi:hypothetical protein
LNAKHVILPGSKRAKHRLAERIGPVDPKERLEVTINLGKMPDAPEVAAKTLSLEELETLYGAKKMRTKWRPRSRDSGSRWKEYRC